MSCHDVYRLGSKFEVIEVLQSLLKQSELCGNLQAEWKVISSHLELALGPLGRNGWDFALMDWPAHIPLFNVTINKSSLFSTLFVDHLVDLLTTLNLNWCIRIECLNRIQNDLMVGGDDLRDVLVTKDKVYEWKAEVFQVRACGD